MTRFAGQDNILGKIQELERAGAEGSVPYLTPYMSSQRPPKYGSGGRSYFDYIEDKRKELDDIVSKDGGPWKKPDEDVKPVEPDPDPDPDPDPEPEIDPERKAAQDKWRKILAKHIEEGKRYGRSEQESMDQAVYLSRVMTPEENADYNWAFEGLANDGHGVKWKKWGGGRKQGSGGRTRKAGEKSGPGLGFHVGQAVRGIKARFSPTQGKGIKTGADGFGYSNHSRKHSYNTHGVGKRSAPF